jgi:predicted protein tyrosine phosphatase
MKVLILNKAEFNKFMEYNAITDDNVETKDAMFISLNSPFNGELLFGAQTTVESYFKRQHSNVMIMHFGDYGEEFVLRNIHKGPTGLFNEHKAKKLYEFIKRNKDKSMAIVHCGAGISRSGAVGTFIHDLYGTITSEEFKRKNPRIQPNGHILKLLRTEFEKDI